MKKRLRKCNYACRQTYSVMLGLTLMLFFSFQAFAQTQTIKGRVIDSAGLEIIGAAVQVDGTSLGGITDLDGVFVINNAPAKGTLTVSYVGYKTTKTAIKPGKQYVIKLLEDTKVLEEVVVVGYGTMRKKELTGAVSRVMSDDIQKISSSDVGSTLQGQIAGVNIQASSGAPGAAANIQIRGISSINGSNNPLWVVDGIPYDGDPGLSPHEIESIDVLKDAASAAIYGTRGAGGVILVTTKSGKTGEMKVSLDANYGIQKITSGLELTNATQSQYLQYLLSGQDGLIAPSSLWSTLWQNPNLFLNNTNLMPVVEQDNQPVTNIALTLSGGTKNYTYSIVGNYYKQEGILINSGYERFNVRANSTLKKGRWSFNTSLSAKVDTKDSPAWGVYQEIYKYKPTQQAIDLDAPISSSGGDNNENLTLGNVLAKFKETNTSEGKGFNGSFSANLEIIKGLNFTSRFGAGYNVNNIVKINPFFEIYDSEGNLVLNPQTRSGIRNTNQVNTNMSWENILNYGLKKGKHDIKATAVFSMEKYTFKSFFADRKDLISNDLPSLGAATGESLVGVGTGTWGQDRVSTLVGMLLRAQYSYADRYLFSASVRRDGSSRFSKDNRWGYFPSVSAGWNISEENFWKPVKDIVNSFKLRVSYGTTGNQNFGDYTTATTISQKYDYAFIGSNGLVLNNGSIQTVYANANSKWETTEQFNLGFDLAFLQNKLTFNTDLYLSKKRNMLFPLKIPPVAGTGNNGSVVLNVGDMENKGIEMALGWRDKISTVNYRVNATFTRNINTVTRMAGTNKRSPMGTISTGNSNDQITFLCEGMEAGVFMMMPTNGIVNTDQKLAEYQKLRPDAKMGDLMYVDQNGDGLLNDDDRVNCGSGAPEAEIGLNYGLDWNGFDFSMNWYASIGNEIVNGSKVTSYQNGVNKDQVYQWSMYNPYSTIPRIADSKHYNTRAYADIWVEDGSFVRLKNIVLGYSLPKHLVTKWGLGKLRFYVAADNLLTFTKYDGYNPEVGNDGLATKGLDMGTYPIAIQMRGGIQLDF